MELRSSVGAVRRVMPEERSSMSLGAFFPDVAVLA